LRKLTIKSAAIGLTCGLACISLLMPFSVEAYSGSSQLKKSIYLNGQLMTRPYGAVYNSTTYMPIWYVMQILNHLGMQNTWDGTSWSITTPANWNPDLSNVATKSGAKSIVLNGTLVQKIDSRVYQDPSSNAATTYMPIWYVMQILQRVLVHSNWDGSTWSLATAPGQLPTPGLKNGKLVSGWTNSSDSMNTALADSGILSEVGSVCFTIAPNATIAGTVPSTFLGNAKTKGLQVYATVQNYDDNGFDGKAMANILASPALSSTLIQNLVSAVITNGFDGLDLDIEMLPASSRDAFSSFVLQLDSELRAKGKLLNVDVPAETGPTAESWDRAYDYGAIAESADTVSIMTYDFTWINNPPGAIAPLWWDKKVLDYAATVIPKNKIVMGIGAYGYDWGPSGNAKGLSLNKIDGLLALPSAVEWFDTADDSPYLTYTALDGTAHTVYYENQQSITDKLNLAKSENIAGMAVWSVGLTDPQFWNAVQAFES
jgi:spore germination protein YaaH